ncbi:MAG: hypothetical protein AAGF07_03375 [Patescibacteria group bacterium]
MSKLDKYFENWMSIFRTYYNLPLLIKVFFFVAIVFGTVIRLQNLFHYGYYFDTVYTQYNWGKVGFEIGIFEFWKSYDGFFDYSFLSLILETVLYSISRLFTETATGFVVALKSFNWFVEICLVGYVFRLVRKYSPEKNLRVKYSISFFLGGLIYCLPSLWFVSAVWGQNDTLISLLGAISLELIFLKPANENNNLAKEKKFGNIISIFRDRFFWSGLVFAFGFWIKQQIIMILPVLMIYHLKGKTWWDILNIILWSSPVFLCFALGLRYFEVSDFAATRNIGLVGLVFISVSLFAFVGKLDRWVYARRQGFGFLIVSLSILIPCLALNYIRTGSTMFAVVGRLNISSNGAANLWRLLGVDGDASQPLLNVNGQELLTISSVGILIYTVVMLVLYLNYQHISWRRLFSNDIKNLQSLVTRALTFKDAITITTISSGAYFMFFTKMHSRYLHFFIVFSILSLAFLKFSKLFMWWLVIVLFVHFAYFLNQLGVYYDQNNPYPGWIIEIIESFNSEYWSYWKFSSLISLLGILKLHSLAIKILKILPK